MIKTFGGYQYSQNARVLSLNDLAIVVRENPTAFSLVKSAQSNRSWASILGGAGGALIGYPIGKSLGGGDPNWILAAVGAGLILIAIPVSSGANKKAKEAVEIYNSGLTYHPKEKVHFTAITTGNSIGLRVNF